MTPTPRYSLASHRDFLPTIDLLTRLRFAGFTPESLITSDEKTRVEALTGNPDEFVAIAIAIIEAGVATLTLRHNGRTPSVVFVTGNDPSELVNDYTNIPALDEIMEKHSDDWSNYPHTTTHHE